MLLGMFCFQSFIFSQNKWQYINDNPPHLRVYSSDVIGNTAYFWCVENIVYKTSDGGQSFEISLPYAPTDNTVLGCCDNHGIAFATSNIGYITDGAHGEFRTIDGGQTWVKRVNLGFGASFVDFGSEAVGWKVGSGLYKTIDAGQSWENISFNPLFEKGYFSYIYALDENKVWVLKSFHYGNMKGGSIWASSDGGISWNRQLTDIPSNQENQITYNNILITKNGFGIAVGKINRPSLNEQKSFVQKTNDFGITWTTLELSDKDLRNILAINDSTWIIVGNENISNENKLIQLRSNDKGQSWVESYPFEYENYNYLNSASYIPIYNTILISTAWGIYKSIDQGKTYFRINTELDIYVKNLNLDRKPITPAKQVIIANSSQNSYLLSQDAGSTWQKKQIPSELGYEIWDIKIAEGIIYMIIDQKRLYKSTDFGESWLHKYTPTYAAIKGLDVLDKNTLVLKSYPDLFTSRDGGDTWTSTPFPKGFYINQSFMNSVNNIVAVGKFFNSNSKKQGFIYSTLDNGYNWQIKDTPSEMKQIKMINSNIGYALGKYHFYKTIDAGNTWTIIKSFNNLSQSFSAFCFRDTLNGLLHQGIYFYETKDGGKSWAKVDLDFPYEHVDRIEVNSKGDYFAVSGGNLLFSSFTGSENFQQFTKEVEKNKVLLFQNHPNPFNPITNISFSIAKEGFVNLNIYNVLGELVNELVNESLVEGNYSYQFNAKNLSSGIYFYSISINGFTEVKKMMLLK